MPDYNLGRAHGEVVITADTKGAQQALGDYEKQTKSATQATSDFSRVEAELTKRRQEAEQASQKRKDAEVEYRRVMADNTSTIHEQTRAESARNQARGEALQAAKRAAEGERAYRQAIDGNSASMRKFLGDLDHLGTAHDKNTRKMRDWHKELKETDNTIKQLSSTLTKTFGAALKGIGYGAAGGAAAGGLGLLGGGGVQGIMASVEAIKDFSGVLLLLPAVVGGAATVLGTLAVSFNGVGDALKAMDDPVKFQQALRQLAPAAAQVVTILASFENAFKGAMRAVQQEFFTPLVDQIQPLVYMWLPALMNAGQQVAQVLGQAGRVIAQWLQQPQTMSAFQDFITNVVAGLRAMLPAIQPIANAFLTLTDVGSKFFPQIADSIVRIANAFNAWVQGAAQSGQLQSWIQTSINAFSMLWDILKNVFAAFSNIGALADKGGGLLGFLVSITQQFKDWTESAKGAALITDFFANMKAASDVLGPILKIIGEAVLQLFNNLAQVGTASGSGITSLFKSLAEALDVLGKALIGSGPALGDIMKSIGEAILGVVQALGPSLPQLFRSLAQVLADVAPAAAQVAQALANVLQHITPTEIEAIIGIVAAFQGLSVVLPIIIGAISGVTAVMAAFGVGAGLAIAIIGGIAVALVALVAGIIYVATHWDQVKTAMGQVWDSMKEFGNWISSTFVGLWDNVANAVSGAWDRITSSMSNWMSQAYDWGRNIIQNLIDGIGSMFDDVGNIVGKIAGSIKDHLFTQSPAKVGPLHDVSPNQMGQSVAKNFADGISGGSGDVTSASAGLAGSVFSSSGVQGSSGGSFGGGSSGFDQYIKSLTTELSSWSSLLHGAFDLFTKVSSIFIDTTKVVASLWNKGDNPLTRPGGIAGPPLAANQQHVPGVPDGPGVAGVAPLPNLVPHPTGGTTPAVAQHGVPGVPSAGGKGGWSPGQQAPPSGTPPANPPAQTQGGPGGGIPLVQKPDGTWTSSDPAWAALIKRESGGSLTVPNLTDSNAAAGHPSLGLFQITQPTWESNGGLVLAPSPDKATAQQQAQVAANIFRARGGQPWGAGLPGREDEAALRAGLTGGTPTTGVPPANPPASTTGAAPSRSNYNPQVAAADAAILGPNYGKAVLPNVEGSRTVNNPSGVVLGVPLDQQRPSPQVGLSDATQPLIGPGGGPGGIPGAPDPKTVMQGVNLSTIPVAVQKYAGDCIDASARIILSHSGVSMSEDQISNVIAQGTNIGTQAAGLNKLLPQGNFKAMEGSGGSQQVMFDAIKTSIDQGVGSILNVAPGSSIAGRTFAPGHFIAATGYNPDGTINLSDTANGKVYSVTQADAFQATQGRGIVAGTGTGPPPIGGVAQPPSPQTGRAAPVDVNIAQSGGVTLAGTPEIPGGTPLIGGAQSNQIVPPGNIAYRNGQLQIGQGAALPPGIQGTYDPNKPLVGPGGQVAPDVYNKLLPQAPGAGEGLGTTPFQSPGGNNQGSGSTKSPLDQFSSAISGASSVAGAAFEVFDNMIKSITAAANIADTLVRGPENTEDIMKLIDNYQQFVTTAASVAKLVGAVGGAIGGAGSGDPTGMTGAIGGGIQAIAGIVQSGLEAYNTAIDLGQEVWHQASKYGAMLAAFTLGNSQTGPLGGNVRMLLNTNTGQMYSYSEDNPQNKAVHDLPNWFKNSYTSRQAAGAQPNTQVNQLNMYVGPGQTPMQMMSDSMWLIGTGAPSVASVAGLN